MNNRNMQGFKIFAVLVATIALWAGSVSVTQAALTVVLQDSFPGPALDAGWVNSGSPNWAWNPQVGGVAFSGGSGAVMAHALSAPTSENWSVELRYGWYNGSVGQSTARSRFGVLDSLGNGYGMYIQAGSGADTLDIQKSTAGVWGTLTAGYPTGYFAKPNDTPLAAGGALTPLRLDYQASTGLLSLYLGVPGGAAGSANTLIGTATDTAFLGTTFTQFQLLDVSGAPHYAIFDDVLVSTGVPEPSVILLLVIGGTLVLRRRRSTGAV